MKLVPRNNNLGFSLFDNMFDDMFRDPFFTNSNNTKLMKTDIQEKDNNYILDMDLPGYEKEDIKAQLKDGYLTITAQKNTSNDDKDEEGNYIRRERYCGKCSRSFYVGDSIKEEDIKANFKNGILQLTFPKEVARKEDEEIKKYQKDYLEVDFISRKVLIDQEEIHLTPIEFNLLKLLIEHRGKVLTHNYIQKEIWGYQDHSNQNALRVFMATLRRKIEKDTNHPRFIVTEVGVGYYFKD